MAEKVVNLEKKIYEKLFLKGEKKFRKGSIVNSYFEGILSLSCEHLILFLWHPDLF